VDPEALDVLVDTFENKVGPRNGAQVVARAWVDSAYKQRLLDDGTEFLHLLIHLFCKRVEIRGQLEGVGLLLSP